MIYVDELDKRIKILLHSCCAPCSSQSIEYLKDYFDISIFYYNPNITDELEFNKRLNEQIEYINKRNYSIEVYKEDYSNKEFFEIAKGLEDLPEGSLRCFKCYELRLRKTALKAKELGFDSFSTTLSISPYKNSKKLNEIGEKIEKEVGIPYVYLDLKKKDGYKKSIEYSKEYNLYRQNYCGCVYSLRDYLRKCESKK